MLAIFPITLYNYIINKIKKIVIKLRKEKEKTNEKNTIIDNITNNDNVSSSL